MQELAWHARKGLDNARGEYVIHADPDDWVEPDMLKELYAKAKEEDADMVICDFYAHYGEKVVYVCQQPSALDHDTVLCELFQQLHGSCCNNWQLSWSNAEGCWHT